MKNTFIYPKNYFSKKNLFLEDSKWKIYNISNNNAFKEKNDKIYNTNSNYNLYKNQYLTNNYKSIPIINNELDNKIENIKLSLYSKINQNSSQLLILLEKIKYLTKENISLKKIIKNKDKIISDFESLFHKCKEKFIKLDNINLSLRNKLMGKGEITQDINLENSNKKCLLEYFNIIKNDLNKIESDYYKKLREKDELLDKMNEELLYIHKEYKNLSEILEKINDFIMNTNYNDLKNKVNQLLEKNESLSKQNEKREKRIIDSQKKNEIPLEENDNMNKYNNDDLIFTFKNQENEYAKTINMIQNRILGKDQEIKMIKEEYNNILNDKDNFS